MKLHLYLFLYFIGNISQSFAQISDSLYTLTVIDLLETESTLASGVKETPLSAPASMVVLTAEDIMQRGYTSLDEIIADLPDFDVVHLSGGMGYINAYQRGYRTVNTQRTLFMIDGIVANHLWSHIAAIGPQFPLSSIARVEVLSGPASVVYGANAFLGIINIVTKKEKEKKCTGNVRLMGGSFETSAADASTEGNISGVSYAISGRFYQGEAEDISNRWYFLSNELYSNKNVWGPMLNHKIKGKKLGHYRNLNTEYGVLANLSYKGFEAGMIKWQRVSGQGSEYTADRAQSNAAWRTSASQYYLRHQLASPKLNNRAILLYRVSHILGDWTEAEPDKAFGMEQFSYLSHTQWHTISTSFLFKDNFNAKFNNWVQLLTGVKYERKDLTKNYDVPGYWNGSYASVILEDPDGPYGLGGGITHSTDSSFIISPVPFKKMPADNRVVTHDLGGYLLGVFDIGKFRLNAGIRYDHNSIYGQSINPRVSLIYNPNTHSAIKLMYGEAFQEPQPRALWGNWNGRETNENLKPEKVKNIEVNLLYKTGDLLHEAVAYYAQYFDVIKEEAENAGNRDVIGLGYKLNYSIPHFIKGISPIKGYLYYNFSMAHSSLFYNHVNRTWEEGRAFLGDIAPHKINIGLTFPIHKNFFINLRSNIVSERTLYLRNPLRNKGKILAAYHTLSTNIAYAYNLLRIAFKVNNLFNHHYLVPGIRNADSGNDFNQRSKGYFNSLIPAPGRSFMVSATVNF